MDFDGTAYCWYHSLYSLENIEFMYVYVTHFIVLKVEDILKHIGIYSSSQVSCICSTVILLFYAVHRTEMHGQLLYLVFVFVENCSLLVSVAFTDMNH